MKLRPEELEKNGYLLLDGLNHKELVPFIQIYMKKRTKFSFLYYLANALFVSICFFLFIEAYLDASQTIADSYLHFSYGLAFAFLLLPIHELIHALAYRICGAQKTSFHANWRKFYFYAVADGFVASRKEFQFVALAPFVSISVVLLALFFLIGQPWNFTFLGTLILHSAFCSGDFGLLSYFDFHKDKEVVTYDDDQNQISYFYARPLK